MGVLQTVTLDKNVVVIPTGPCHLVYQLQRLDNTLKIINSLFFHEPTNNLVLIILPVRCIHL